MNEEKTNKRTIPCLFPALKLTNVQPLSLVSTRRYPFKHHFEADLFGFNNKNNNKVRVRESSRSTNAVVVLLLLWCLVASDVSAGAFWLPGCLCLACCLKRVRSLLAQSSDFRRLVSGDASQCDVFLGDTLLMRLLGSFVSVAI